jgi:PDDEXK-like domain of unknown function (DUF3799)
MSFQNARIKAVSPNPRDYFTQPVSRGDAKFEISSSALKEADRCFERWRDGYEGKDSKSKDFGNVVDCLALTPADFHKRFAVQPANYTSDGMQCPSCKSVTDSKKCKACGVDRVKVSTEKPWSNQSTTCAEWSEKQIAAGFSVVSPTQFSDAQAAIFKLRRDPAIARFIDASDKQVWVAGEWHDEATGLIIPVKCLIDVVPRNDSEFSKNLGDLKTARNAGLAPWGRQVYDMGYYIQAAFNFDLYKAARPDEDRCNFCFIVQENYAPWQTGKRILSEAFIELGRAAYTRALKNYAQCLKHGQWPGYDCTDEAVQNWSITEPSPWMESASLFAPRFELAAETEDAPPSEILDYRH